MRFSDLLGDRIDGAGTLLQDDKRYIIDIHINDLICPGPESNRHEIALEGF